MDVRCCRWLDDAHARGCIVSSCKADIEDTEIWYVYAKDHDDISLRCSMSDAILVCCHYGDSTRILKFQGYSTLSQRDKSTLRKMRGMGDVGAIPDDVWCRMSKIYHQLLKQGGRHA